VDLLQKICANFQTSYKDNYMLFVNSFSHGFHMGLALSEPRLNPARAIRSCIFPRSDFIGNERTASAWRDDERKEADNHQLMPMLLHYSKPFRCRQTPRVTRNLQSQRSLSVTRCNHSSKYVRNHFQSHYDDESMMEMSVRCLLRLTRLSRMSKYQESEPQAGQTL
jgi:hypothetical protein